MDSPDYPYSANLSVADNVVECAYSSPDCPVGYECIVSLNETLPAYPNTSMHVAQCFGDGVYDEKLCCKLTEGGGEEPIIPEFSFTTLILAVILAVAGTLIIRKRRGIQK